MYVYEVVYYTCRILSPLVDPKNDDDDDDGEPPPPPPPSQPFPSAREARNKGKKKAIILAKLS
jgi:hypothetical protein